MPRRCKYRRIFPLAVAFVANDAVRRLPRASPSHPLDGFLFHQWLEGHRFVTLARGEKENHKLAFSFRPEVHLGREATPAIA